MTERLIVTAEPQRRLAVHRQAKVECPACGREVPRQSRQQRFCSERCRKREHAKKRVWKPGLVRGTRGTTDPANSVKKINGLEPAPSRPNPRISGVLDALALKAASTLKWPGWTEADYRRAYERLERDPAFSPGGRAGRQAAR
jgi:hypothetical protein